MTLVLCLAACQGDGASGPGPVAAPAPVASPATAPRGPLKILALGDSYTIGHGAPETDRWPEQLARLLRAEGIAAEPPRIIARTGWTAKELLGALEKAEPKGPFGLVTLLVGVNDQYRGHRVGAFVSAFQELLARATELAGGVPARVVVVSIPDWGATAFALHEDRRQIANEIDAFNQAARDEAGKAGARWVDVTALSRRAGADPAYLVRDGLHPSGKAYGEWAAEVLPVARTAISAR